MHLKGKTGLHGKLSSSKNGIDRGAEENCVTKRESKTLNNGLQGAQMLNVLAFEKQNWLASSCTRDSEEWVKWSLKNSQ